MRTLELRKLVGLENHQNWPRRLAWSMDTVGFGMAKADEVERELSRLGYSITTGVRRMDGFMDFIAIRHTELENAETLLIKLLEAIESEPHERESRVDQTVEEVKAWLKDLK